MRKVGMHAVASDKNDGDMEKKLAKARKENKSLRDENKALQTENRRLSEENEVLRAAGGDGEKA